MKLNSEFTINGKWYPKGAIIPWYFIYPFFMLHMAVFGLSGFFMAYSEERPDVPFLYMHGGLAITVYLVFYLAIFGPDRVRWMFINAGLGLFGISAEIGWILRLFGRSLGDFAFYVHVIPFLYYILYTFLLRQFFLDISRARDNPARQRQVEQLYVAVSVIVYLLIFLITR